MILQYCCSGFPHSDICVSMDICSSTQLFAACHVLLRLLMPRHSSYALLRLTSPKNFRFLVLSNSFKNNLSFSLSSLRFYVSKFCSVISSRYLVQLSQHFFVTLFLFEKTFSFLLLLLIQFSNIVEIHFFVQIAFRNPSLFQWFLLFPKKFDFVSFPGTLLSFKPGFEVRLL